MMGLNLSKWALTHRSLTIFLMMVAVGAGIMSYFRLGRSEETLRPIIGNDGERTQIWRVKTSY